MAERSPYFSEAQLKRAIRRRQQVDETWEETAEYMRCDNYVSLRSTCNAYEKGKWKGKAVEWQRTRGKMLALIEVQKMTPSEIAKKLKMSRSAVHRAIMKERFARKERAKI